MSTRVTIWDLADPEEPVLLETYEQLGARSVCWTAGEKLYLTTEDGVCACGWSRLDDVSGYYPALTHNGEKVPWGDEDKELLRWYEAITTLRAKSKTLTRGRWYPIKTTDDLLAYLRVYRQTVILCLFNRSDHAFVTLKHDLFRGVIGRDMLNHTWEKLDGITVLPLSAKIYRLQTTAKKLFKDRNEIQSLLTQIIDSENE